MSAGPLNKNCEFRFSGVFAEVRPTHPLSLRSLTTDVNPQKQHSTRLVPGNVGPTHSDDVAEAIVNLRSGGLTNRYLLVRVLRAHVCLGVTYEPSGMMSSGAAPSRPPSHTRPALRGVRCDCTENVRGA